MAVDFVHLHNHSEYSLLDGAQRIETMVQHAKANGMTALALTDHGVMYGAMEFYYACQEHGIKPILGMEAYVISEQEKGARPQTYHLLLLAETREGYRNLCRLATLSAQNLISGKPTVDLQTLADHANGIVSSTTCLSGEVCTLLAEGNEKGARKAMERYLDIFGRDRYFVELQDHGIPTQKQVNESLIQIAKEMDLPLICTNDSHYLRKEDADAHDVLLCIQTGKQVSESDRLRFDTKEFYLKAPDEMAEVFAHVPEALSNTVHLAERIHTDLAQEMVELPDPDFPEGVTPQEYLRHLAYEGVKERLRNPSDEHFERLDYELGVIEQTGFAKYFLVVREFAQFARRHGIRFGPRGSAAGSLVSFAIGITDIDPIRWGLTFERFLNPERIAMPDIDMDFEDTRRDEVIQFARERFGQDHVAQIITFGTMGAKQSIRDAARALGIRADVADRLCRLIPSLPGATIESAIREIEQFRAEYEKDEEVRRLVDTARELEGVARHAGVHAAGIVISKEPIAEIVPIGRSADGQPLTQYPMEVLEKLGLLKMDILGLSNLTVVSRCLDYIERAGKPRLKIEEIPLDDKETFEMLGRGETAGVFQLEGSGMTRYVQQLKPDSLGELAAMVALYRPGPMDHIPRYIDGKFGRVKPTYLDPRMEPILAETYGVIVYQDQVLQLVRALAGFSLGEADVLRKAMGKKKKELLEESEAKFIAGAVRNGMTEKAAREVFELLRPFAGYAFNKAHAVCYGLLAYQTAYLKAHYPVEYMAAILTAYQGNTDKVVGYINECRRMGIEVLPPDVNRSDISFTVDEVEGRACVRFGLGAIKGIGEAAIKNILKAREDGPFKGLFDFVTRVREHGSINKTALEALIKAGALDSFAEHRRILLESMESALSFADQQAKNRESGQRDLFGGDSDDSTETHPPLAQAEPPERAVLRSMEREVLGICLSDHPLRGLEETLDRLASHPLSDLAEVPDDENVRLVGVVAELQRRTTRRGSEMALLTLEDLTGHARVIVFDSVLGESGDLLNADEVIVVKGKIRHREDGGENSVEVIASSIGRLEDAASAANKANNGSAGTNGSPPKNGSASNGKEKKDKQDTASVPEHGVLSVRVLKASRQQLESAKRLMQAHPGPFEVRMYVVKDGREVEFPLPLSVSDGEWLRDLRRTFDTAFVRLDRLSPAAWVQSR